MSDLRHTPRSIDRFLSIYWRLSGPPFLDDLFDRSDDPCHLTSSYSLLTCQDPVQIWRCYSSLLNSFLTCSGHKPGHVNDLSWIVRKHTSRAILRSCFLTFFFKIKINRKIYFFKKNNKINLKKNCKRKQSKNRSPELHGNLVYDVFAIRPRIPVIQVNPSDDPVRYLLI